LGGGIENLGHLTVTNSTISNNSLSSNDGGGSFGGGIDNYGLLFVIGSTFSNNSTLSSGSGSNCLSGGSGIYNHSHGILTVTSSTFSNNSALCSGGGSFGGGIVDDGKLTVVASTFSHNSVSGSDSQGGGIYYTGGNDTSAAIIRFCTIYGNTSSAGGGIWIDPTGSHPMTISSSIIAANSANDGPDISGALISDGYNRIENVAGSKARYATTDRQVTLSALKIDPTLRNNGGPTQTLVLLPGSQAIDVVPGEVCRITVTDVSGHTATITMDQRGNSRPDGSEKMCDTGAYESSY